MTLPDETIELHCAECGGAVTLQLVTAMRMDPHETQRWACPHCAKTNEIQIDRMIGWAIPGQDESRT